MHVTLGKGLAVCDGCVCRLVGVRTVMGEVASRSLLFLRLGCDQETSQKPRCPGVLWGSRSARALVGVT